MKPQLILSEREELIATILKSTGIQKSLTPELLDHLYSHTEDLMHRHSLSFEKALTIALEELAPQGFPELQEQVEDAARPIPYLEYITNVTGVAAALALVAGYWFKLQGWPYGMQLIYGGLFAFVGAFMPMRLIEQLPQATGKRRKELILELLSATGFSAGIINGLMKGSPQFTHGMITFAFIIFVIQILPKMFDGLFSARIAED